MESQELPILLQRLQSLDATLWPEEIIQYLRVRVSNERHAGMAPILDELAEAIRHVPRPGDQRDRWSATATVLTFESPCVARAVEIIRERYRDSLTTAMLAREVGRDRSHLIVSFRRQVGTTVHRYITKVRIQHAALMILDGDKIDAVATAVGYRSRATFFRQFRATMGMTPQSFRTQRGNSALEVVTGTHDDS